MSSTDTTHTHAPAGYRLGDPIPLEDLVALPPDGRRYTRDAEGRLALMSPDHAGRHRRPLTRLTRLLNRALDDPWEVAHEPSLAFPRLISLQGRVLERSRLGRAAIEPDLAVFAAPPDLVLGNPAGASSTWDLYGPDRLRLVVEFVSASSWRADLGLGAADEVNRWRTYLENGVPELWVLNAGVPGVALPPRSALFCAPGRDAWEPLAGEGLTFAEGEVQGLRPVQGGRIPSRALPGFVFDLDAFWADALRASSP